MAKSKREKLRRQMAHAYRNLSLAIDHLGQVESQFAEHHQDYAESLQMMIGTIDAVRDALKAFWLKAWGKVPTNWERWRNVGNPKPGETYGD